MSIRALLMNVNAATGADLPADEIDVRSAMLAVMLPDLPGHALGDRTNVAAWHTFTRFPSVMELAGWLRGVAIIAAPQVSREQTPEPLAETPRPGLGPDVGRLVPRQAGA